MDVTRNGRPLWRSLLHVLHENKRQMVELGVKYDVQLTIAAILKVIRDIPRIHHPIFGVKFTAAVEDMTERLLSIKYDERTKYSSDPNANWYQGLLTGLVTAVTNEEDRLSAYFVDPIDDIPSIDQIDPTPSKSAGVVRGRVCIRHALGANGCKFGTKGCRFSHVDYEALDPCQKDFARSFLKTHKGPLVLDCEKLQSLGVKESGQKTTFKVNYPA